MGWLLFETAAGLKTEGGRILLPASVPMRARQFETACRALLLRAGIAIPVLPSMAINFETPGQWDGLVRLADGLFILESKACLKPLTNVPKLAKRAEEAKIAGFAGVIVVSLSGFSDSLNLPEACVSVRLSSVAQLSGSIPKDSFLMPTGDTLEPTGYFSSTFSQGLGVRSFMLSEIRSRSLSKSTTITLTLSPIASISEGWLTLPQEMSVM